MATPIDQILSRLADFRKAAGLNADEVEREMLLGPGWIERFESGTTVPPLDLLLVLLKKYGKEPSELFQSVEAEEQPDEVVRALYAEPDADDLVIHFNYTQFDAQYRLKNATIDQYNDVIKTLRDGLAGLSKAGDDEAVKAESVAKAFLKAVQFWPHVNPSDLWWFLVNRAYHDPYNHPAQYARLDLGQSWKRTGGWSLEIVLVRHYGAFLKSKGVLLYIADGAEKSGLVKQFTVKDRLEADKIDVVLAGEKNGKKTPFGVVHVKASFAERRTDDVPMSQALVAAGYTSPLWTMDCKGTPAALPVNRGELGSALATGPDARSAKRKDIEDDGYFSACFSYNKNTVATPSEQKSKARIYCCDFSNPDDVFSQFIIKAWTDFAAKNGIK